MKKHFEKELRRLIDKDLTEDLRIGSPTSEDIQEEMQKVAYFVYNLYKDNEIAPWSTKMTIKRLNKARFDRNGEEE